MDKIIAKAIEGGYEHSDYDLTRFNGLAEATLPDVMCHIVCDPLFWQSLGKSCGWIEVCDNPGHGIINAMAGVKITDINRLGCPGCGHNEDHIVESTRNNHIKYALRFHEINLTEGWSEAVEYLSKIIQ